VDITLPIKVEVNGRASSVYDRETIDRRLEALAGRTDEPAEEERVFLQALKAKLDARVQTVQPG
jgi:hypothetical protein